MLKTWRVAAVILIIAVIAVNLPYCAEGNKPFSIALSGETSFLKSGGRMPIIITLTNKCGREIELERVAPDVDYLIEVTDATGRQFPNNRIQTTSAVPVVKIKAGDTLQDVLFLDQMYGVTQPGDYQITAERAIPNRLSYSIYYSIMWRLRFLTYGHLLGETPRIVRSNQIAIRVD